eukprot:gene26080-biopygen13677
MEKVCFQIPVFPLPYLPYMARRHNKAAVAALLCLLAIYG